jgi:hypothetical protein
MFFDWSNALHTSKVYQLFDSFVTKIADFIPLAPCRPLVSHLSRAWALVILGTMGGRDKQIACYW